MLALLCTSSFETRISQQIFNIYTDWAKEYLVWLNVIGSVNYTLFPSVLAAYSIVQAM